MRTNIDVPQVQAGLVKELQIYHIDVPQVQAGLFCQSKYVV